jgi:hypothetical protein
MARQQQAPQGRNSAALMIAGGYLSPDEKQILRDYEKTLLMQNTKSAQKELERMNKMYRQYGMHFGGTQLPGV